MKFYLEMHCGGKWTVKPAFPSLAASREMIEIKVILW